MAQIAKPMEQIDKITVIDNGSGDGGSKVSKIVSDVAANGFEVLKDLTGADLGEVVRTIANKNSDNKPKLNKLNYSSLMSICLLKRSFYENSETLLLNQCFTVPLLNLPASFSSILFEIPNLPHKKSSISSGLFPAKSFSSIPIDDIILLTRLNISLSPC